MDGTLLQNGETKPGAVLSGLGRAHNRESESLHRGLSRLDAGGHPREGAHRQTSRAGRFLKDPKALSSES